MKNFKKYINLLILFVLSFTLLSVSFTASSVQITNKDLYVIGRKPTPCSTFNISFTDNGLNNGKFVTGNEVFVTVIPIPATVGIPCAQAIGTLKYRLPISNDVKGVVKVTVNGRKFTCVKPKTLKVNIPQSCTLAIP